VAATTLEARETTVAKDKVAHVQVANRPSLSISHVGSSQIAGGALLQRNGYVDHAAGRRLNFPNISGRSVHIQQTMISQLATRQLKDNS
jgi:hypothetical protein